MTPNAIAINKDADLAEAAKIMTRRQASGHKRAEMMMPG
jgi:hypothetical protein